MDQVGKNNRLMSASRELGLVASLVELPRVERAAARWGETFLVACSQMQSPGMLDHYQGLAGRFAAKEAVIRVLALGRRSMTWHEIEMGPDPLSINGSGQSVGYS